MSTSEPTPNDDQDPVDVTNVENPLWWKTPLVIYSAAILGVLLLTFIVFSIGYARGNRAMAAAQASKAAWWTCSMHPQVKLPTKGKCPICFMDLIPLDEGAAGSGHPRELSMSPEAVALAEIQTMPVLRKSMSHNIRLQGKVDYDETKLAYITAWVPGRLDRLFIDNIGVTVNEGDHLVEIYSPDLVEDQRGLLQMWRAFKANPNDEFAKQNLNSAEKRLRLKGVLPRQIEDIKKLGKPSDRMTIYVENTGVIIHKNANEGMYVKTGAPIYTIADLSQVWIHMDAYESDVSWVKYGQQVEFTTDTYPGEIFKGRVAQIYPALDENTRTVKVRVNVANPGNRLKPGMFVSAQVKSQIAEGGKVIDDSLVGKWVSPHHPEIIRDKPGKCPICEIDLVPASELGFVQEGLPPLVIPASAPLMTGTRAVVYVSIDPLRFESWQIVDWENLIERLMTQPKEGQSAAADRIYRLLGSDVKNDLVEYQETEILRPKTKHMLLHDLNRLLENDELYREKDWHGLDLADEIAGINEKSVKHFTAVELKLANRRLIEAALADEIKSVSSNPTFQGREVLLGARVAPPAGQESGDYYGDYYVVRFGLDEDDEVVFKGNFKIDSALQIAAKRSMMSPTGGATSSGHEHHGKPSSSSHDEHAGHRMEQPKKTAQLEVPVRFRLELSPTYQAYLVAGEALAGDKLEGKDIDPDLAKARDELNKMLAALKAVNSAQLAPKVQSQWDEISSNLALNAHETLDAQDLAKARIHFQHLSNAMTPMVEKFGHALNGPLYQFHCQMAFDSQGAKWLQVAGKPRNPYFGPTMLECGDAVATFHPQIPLKVPASFRGQLSSIYTGYLKLQTQLADDDLRKSIDAAVKLHETINTIDPTELEERTAGSWAAAKGQLDSALQGDLTKLSIEKLREQFEPLSLTMLGVVDNFGHASDGPLYRAFCPMAFDNKGAPWLQSDKNIANPYFGAKMPSCGKIERTYEPAVGKSTGNDKENQ